MAVECIFVLGDFGKCTAAIGVDNVLTFSDTWMLQLGITVRERRAMLGQPSTSGPQLKMSLVRVCCHFNINGKRVNIPSYLVGKADSVEVRERSKSVVRIQGALESVKRREIPQLL